VPKTSILFVLLICFECNVAFAGDDRPVTAVEETRFSDRAQVNPEKTQTPEPVSSKITDESEQLKAAADQNEDDNKGTQKVEDVNSFAEGENAPVQPNEHTQVQEPEIEFGSEAGPEPVLPVLPKAENVDLKEVISEPLHQVLPIQESVPEVPSEIKIENVASDTGAEEEVDRKQEQSAPLRLLGSEVAPGTATRLAWAAQEGLAGLSLPTPVLVVHGKHTGPKVCLTAAVHGDELNGIEMVRKVMYDLNPEKLTGSVIGIPIVNIQGFRRASRYLPDRRDLNRYFPGRPNGSSAARIAHSFFTQVIQSCSVLVDIHTGSFRRTNLTQLRSDLSYPEVVKLTEMMGDIVVLQSQGARGALRRAATEAGIPAVTIEAGEPLYVDSESVNKGVSSINILLHKMEMYSMGGIWARKTEPVYYKSHWVRASTGGILMSSIRLGSRVSKEQELARVTDPITNASEIIRSPIEGRVIGMALNQVMLPGFAAFHIGYQATIEEASLQDAGPEEAAGDEMEQEEAPSEQSLPL